MKRKASTPQVDPSDGFAGSDLDSAFSQSEDEEFESALEGDQSDTGDDATDLDDQSDDAKDEHEANGDHRGELGGLQENGTSEWELGDGVRVEKDANGGVRYVYPEIDPVYDSDDSDAKGPVNTIGDPKILRFYESYPHIGYDINGKKILRPATGDALDKLLEDIEVPEGFTGLVDPDTGKPLKLSRSELELIRSIQQQTVPGEEPFDMYPDMVEYFTGTVEDMPLSAAPEPKRRFVPSKHEAKRIMKLVRAIREGRILPYKPPEEREEEEEAGEFFDIWQDEKPQDPHVMHIPAPKLLPPVHDMSYNPPPEYLPTDEEKEQWLETDPEEREKDYIPQTHESLRKVPGYDMFVKERFDRCLDLYLAPRVRKNRLNIDPMSMLPKLPRPEELKPFPTVCQTLFRGHTGRVRSCAISPDGCWLASGGDDATVRVWDLLTGRQVWNVKLPDDEPVNSVRWRPTPGGILAAAAGEDVFLMVPSPVVDPKTEQESRDVINNGFSYAANKPSTYAGNNKEPAAKWVKPGSGLEGNGVLVKMAVRTSAPIKVISWHKRGDYFCTVSPAGQRNSVAIHTLSKHLTQVPFKKSGGLCQAAHFHPWRPLLFVANQRTIRCYDLQRIELVKILQPGAKWISNFDIHAGGNDVIVGSYDRRLLWHDLEMSTRPFQTMRFHERAVRAVRFHKGAHPLFADASDDGTVQVFYGKVVNEAMENPTIIPLKMLRGHEIVQSVGVVDLDWHPREPWLVSAGADGTCRLWM